MKIFYGAQEKREINDSEQNPSKYNTIFFDNDGNDTCYGNHNRESDTIVAGHNKPIKQDSNTDYQKKNGIQIVAFYAGSSHTIQNPQKKGWFHLGVEFRVKAFSESTFRSLIAGQHPLRQA